MYYSSRMDLILIAAAVLPAVLLLIFIERQDRLEKEPRPLLLRLVTRGILATAVAGVVNALGENILDTIFPYGGVVRDALFYYAVVGLCEEGSKYVMLRRTT